MRLSGKKKRELTAADRASAVDIKQADMYVFNMKHQITGKIFSQEHFMVIFDATGKKHVFRQEIEIKPKSGLVS